MNQNPKISVERVARILAVAAATNRLPDDVTEEAAVVVALVDAGATRRRVLDATRELVTAAWIRAGREAATASKPRQLKAAISRLRGVRDLEAQLGLAPATEQPATAPEPPADPVAAEPAGFSTGWEA
ncbi:hypothetical protein [Tsukamurella soli]|uniref:Uncharacterized protein n=1 Tax=Tsukamurella soli TaxID=644556 RepID=A0ABP8KAE0_9ACTN